MPVLVEYYDDNQKGQSCGQVDVEINTPET